MDIEQCTIQPFEFVSFMYLFYLMWFGLRYIYRYISNCSNSVCWRCFYSIELTLHFVTNSSPYACWSSSILPILYIYSLLPVQYCLDNCSLRVNLEVLQHKSSKFFILVEIALYFLINWQEITFISTNTHPNRNIINENSVFSHMSSHLLRCVFISFICFF